MVLHCGQLDRDARAQREEGNGKTVLARLRAVGDAKHCGKTDSKNRLRGCFEKVFGGLSGIPKCPETDHEIPFQTPSNKERLAGRLSSGRVLAMH